MTDATRDDLTERAQQQLDRAYQDRTRRQCSRDDFEMGYLAALADYGVITAFGIGPGGLGAATDPIDVVRRAR